MFAHCGHFIQPGIVVAQFCGDGPKDLHHVPQVWLIPVETQWCFWVCVRKLRWQLILSPVLYFNHFHWSLIGVILLRLRSHCITVKAKKTSKVKRSSLPQNVVWGLRCCHERGGQWNLWDLQSGKEVVLSLAAKSMWPHARQWPVTAMYRWDPCIP